MAFSDGITALLDTYANCISLLKAFKHDRQEGRPAKNQQHSRLRKSLKSDRVLVERAYSSRLSESGSRFKKGDARAISAVDRILKRLKESIASLLRLSSKKDGLDLDYQSLMSLSNTSRVDAIKAINGLSRRIGNTSRSSVVSSTASKISSKTSSSSQRRRRPSSKAEGAPSKQSKNDRPQDSPRKKLKPGVREPKVGGNQETPTKKPRKIPPVSSSPSSKAPETQPRARPPQPVSGDSQRPKAVPKATAPNRISFMSFSSDSTKLGEIPQRKWQSTYHGTATDPDGDEYNVRPMFPLKPYTTEVKERRFWGLFGRRREG